MVEGALRIWRCHGRLLETERSEQATKPELRPAGQHMRHSFCFKWPLDTLEDADDKSCERLCCVVDPLGIIQQIMPSRKKIKGKARSTEHGERQKAKATKEEESQAVVAAADHRCHVQM
eukprot:scaffold27462_cov74-Skeletonema_marinoi.AAC.1